MKLFECTVNCWFCNAESKVSIFKKNSWTCEQCDQYNGFDKYGDYNKSINEMYNDTNANVKYCVNNGTNINSSGNGSSNKLCDKCNANQERKIQELAKFEPKNEKFFEIEYKAEVEKLDQIYGLCIKCQRAVDQHKTNIDRQVGEYNESLMNKNNNNKRKQIAAKTSTLLKPPFNNITNQYIEKNPLAAKLTSTKAHTIAGTVAPYKFTNKTSDFKQQQQQQQQQSPISPQQSNHRSRAMSKKISKKYPDKNLSGIYYMMIIGDTIITFSLMLTFLSDLAHLFHDSGYHRLNNSNILLLIYMNLKYLLPFCTFISVLIVISRFKFSRILFFLCVSMCTLIHLHVYELDQREEHFVLELFVSFCVCLFSLITIFYNISHLIVFCKQKSSPRQQKSNGYLNDVSLMSEKFDESMVNTQQSPIATNRYSNGKNGKNSIRDSRSPPATPASATTTNKNDTLLESPMQVDTSMNDSENTKPILFTQQQQNQLQQQQQQQMQLRSRLPQPKVFYNNRK